MTLPWLDHIVLDASLKKRSSLDQDSLKNLRATLKKGDLIGVKMYMPTHTAGLTGVEFALDVKITPALFVKWKLPDWYHSIPAPSSYESGCGDIDDPAESLQEEYFAQIDAESDVELLVIINGQYMSVESDFVVRYPVQSVQLPSDNEKSE